MSRAAVDLRMSWCRAPHNATKSVRNTVACLARFRSGEARHSRLESEMRCTLGMETIPLPQKCEHKLLEPNTDRDIKATDWRRHLPGARVAQFSPDSRRSTPHSMSLRHLSSFKPCSLRAKCCLFQLRADARPDFREEGEQM